MSNFGLFQQPPTIRAATEVHFTNKVSYFILPVSYRQRVRVATDIAYTYRMRTVVPVSYDVGARLRVKTVASYGVHAGMYKIRAYAQLGFSYRLRKATPAQYGLSTPVRSSLAISYGKAALVRHSTAVAYSKASRVRSSLLASYMQAGPVRSSLFVSYGEAGKVRHAHPVSFGEAVRTRFSLVAAYKDAGSIRATFPIEYYNLQPVRFHTDMLYDTRPVTPVRASTAVRYVSNPYALVSTIDGTPSVVIGNTSSIILGGSVFIDEGEGVWRGNLIVAGMETYLASRLGSPVRVALGDDTYLMFVDSRSLRMTGPAQIDTEVSLVSAGAFLSEPRASTTDVTVPSDMLASQLAEQLAGVVGLDWNMQDWTLPGGVKEWQAAYPMTVIKEIAEAAGGVVDALPSGRLVVRPKFPVSPTKYGYVEPDDTVHTTSSALAVTEEHSTLAMYGTFRIMDKPEDLGDRLEFVQDETDPLRGEIYAYPQPYRTSVELVSTSDANIIISAGQWLYREEEEEIEILGGEGNTQYPIVSIISASWNDQTAGQLGTERYKTTVSVVSGTGYGLLRIRYRTVALVYTVSSVLPDTSQFLLQEV